jgi:hypothetical protein
LKDKEARDQRKKKKENQAPKGEGKKNKRRVRKD